MRVRTVLQWLVCAALSGCAHPTDPFRHSFKEPVARVADFFPPPAIVRVPSADQYQVTYDYARLAGSALPFAIDAAQRACSPGKRAHIVSLGVRTRERGWVTLECI